jgi:hypothetical protein
MSTKITVDYLNESQMTRVRDYLGKLPNKPHEVKSRVGHFTDRCGDYVEVTVDEVDVLVDEHTAKASDPSYRGVTFSVPYTQANHNSSGGERVNLNQTQLKERRRVVKGLVSLLGEFLNKE